MSETELLDALDRRAARAVAALDEAVGARPPSDPPALRPGRRWSPLLAAAALVVVALVAAALLLARTGDEEGTVAGEGEVPVESGDPVTRLALADPAALGYQVRAAFTGDQVPADMDPDPLGLRWAAHVPEGADPLTARVVVTGELPADATDRSGRVVDLAGQEAFVRILGPQVQIVWPSGTGVRHLSSDHLPDAELVDLARRAAEAGWDGRQPLPGHRILHAGPITDLRPSLAYAASGPSGRDGIAYDHADLERDLVIGWSTGTDPEARWAARRSLAPDAERLEVRGQPALFHPGSRGQPGELSWLEADGTLVEAVFHGPPDAMAAVLDEALVRIGADDHDRLVAEHPASSDGMLLDVDDRQLEPVTDGPRLGSLESDDGTGLVRVGVVDQDVTGLHLVLEVDVTDGASGSAYPLRDLATPALLRLGLQDADGNREGSAIGGLAPPGTDGGSVRVVDAATGAEVVPTQVSTGGMPGSDHVLLVVHLPASAGDGPVRIDLGGGVTWQL